VTGASSNQAPPPDALPSPALVRVTRALERATALDRGAAVLARPGRAVSRRPRLDAALRGTWLGHAAHPMLTDFPLGAWTSATLLDLLGGRRSRPAATGLLAFGVAAAVPTALTGLAEWNAVEGRARRIGVVHAAVNSTALLLYAGSLAARLRDRRTSATALAVAGGLTATAGGYFGGHLSLVRKVGTADAEFALPDDPDDTHPVGGHPPVR
jgi:uncharacterized membrane protein